MKIVTALGKKELNDYLRENEEIEVIGRDIQYQEGVFEILETRNDIDLIAVSNLLPEEMNFLFFIEQIKKVRESIEIVVFLKKEDVSVENFLNSKKIYKIYYLDENGIEIFANSLKNNSSRVKDISKEIEDLKNMILCPQKQDEKMYENISKNIITIVGNSGSGKSSISCILAKQIEKQKKKVVLIDFDGSCRTILGITSFEEDNVKISSWLRVVSNVDKDIQRDENREYSIYNLLNTLKKEYEFIIIDVSSNIDYKYINTILKTSTKVLFVLEPNILGISKAQKSLEILINDINLDVDKIKILFNKTNKYQIADSVLEEIFLNFEEIGSISYDEKYNSVLNYNKSIIEKVRIYEGVC